jgi:NAD(P)-dependent dehydrogenase (short-subunit alcohol dehydrogenase family)
MAGRLEGKVAVITGTGAGMGRTAALRFAEEGARVVGCDINTEEAAKTCQLVRDAGGTMECLYPLDLSDESQTKRLMAHAAEVFGGIDILYNNAFQQQLGHVDKMTLDGFEFTVRHTLTITWLATKHAIPYLRQRPGSSIILTGSIAGVSQGAGTPGNVPGFFAYAVSKAGVIRLASLLAVELAEDRIRVNCISPGPIQTELGKTMFGAPGAPFYEPYKRSTVTDRLGIPDDIVKTAIFLASDDAAFITGQHLCVDGGMTGSLGLGAPDKNVSAELDALFGPYFSHDPPM